MALQTSRQHEDGCKRSSLASASPHAFAEPPMTANPIRSVLITGAAGGIGSAMVAYLHQQGWQVIASDHPSACPVPADYPPKGVAWLPADLQHLASGGQPLEAFSAQVAELTSAAPLLAIVHNAALQLLGSFAELSVTDWQTSLAVNLLAPVAISRTLMPHLIANQGSIVHISSIHSQLTKAGFTAYATSKAALSGLTRAMSVEIGAQVRVNAIEPAAIRTPMLEAGFADQLAALAQLEAFHPSGSIGLPLDVARAVSYLIDPANTFLNGCTLELGGGIHNRLHDPG
jgi:NAD(P)-dependent dehydrogenase (short-subunit alcohol dehydrogenase family)